MMSDAYLQSISLDIEAIARTLPPIPGNNQPDAMDARSLPEGLLPETYAQFIWVWGNLHYLRESDPATYTDEVWESICERMAEEADIAASFPDQNTLAKAFVGHSPLDWAARVARLANGSQV